MARKHPVPESEKAIGARLRSFRETKLISQTAFALHAKVSRENLAKYEFGLVPLPYSAGEAICRAHNINQRWLVTGVGPQFPFIEDSRSELAKLSPRLLFSHFYCFPVEKYLKRPAALKEDVVVTVRILLAAYKDASREFKAGRMAEPLFRSVEAQLIQLKDFIEESLEGK